MSKKVLSVVLSILMMATLCATASADSAFVGEGVKTGELHKGDTVTYTVNLKHDSSDYIAAIDGLVTYDSSVLEIAMVTPEDADEDPYQDVTFEGTTSAVANYNEAGKIRFNAAEGVNGYKSFKKGANIIEVKFNVLKDAEDAAISFEAVELFTLENVVVSKEIKESVKVDCVNEKESDVDSDEKDSDDKTTDSEKPVAPPTGDTTSVVVMMVVLATAALAVVIARKRVA